MTEYREIHCPYGDDFEGGDECDRCEQYELCMETYPPVNLIEIPKGATNGDMIKAMFPNAKIVRGLYGISGTPLMCLNLGTRYDVHEMSFVEDWWNAPYKKKGGVAKSEED